MGRLFKIVLYVIILVFVYFWVMTVAKSCNNDSINDMEVLEGDEVIEEEDDFFEFSDDKDKDSDEFEDEEINDSDGQYLSGDPIDYEALDDEIKKTETPPTKKSTVKPKKRVAAPVKKVPTTKTTTKSSLYGDYLVIAGSFRETSNASIMKSKLSKLGYPSEVVNFDESSLDVVIAGRYKSRNEADRASSELSGKGIDNYVHRKQL